MSEANNNQVIEQAVPTFDELGELTKTGLRSVAVEEGFETYTIECQPGSNIGDGFVGIVIKVTIKGTKTDNNEHELSVLCKVQHASKARREQFNSFIMFQREVALYKDYLPALSRFQKELGLKGFTDYPKCYFAEVSEEEKEAVIIMEDLRHIGFGMANKYKPLELEYVEIVLKTLASFHAVSFAFKNLRPEEFEPFKKYNCLMAELMLTPMLIEFFKGLLDSASASFEDNPEIKDKLTNLKENFSENFLFLTNPANAGDFNTIGHGDSWVNNFLFKLDQDGRPTNLALIDWQISRYAPPILDLAYFIFTSTDKALRDAHFEHLQNLYYATLAQTLRQFGCDPESVYPEPEYRSQWVKFGRYGMILSLMVVPVVTQSPSEVADMEQHSEKMSTPDYDPTKDPEMMEKMAAMAARTATRVKEIVGDANSYGFI